MATFRIALSVPALATNNAKADYEATPAANKKDVVFKRFADLLEGVVSGSFRSNKSGQAAPSLAVTIDDNKTAATATVTCITVANNSTVTVGSIVLTGVTGTPSGQAQWKCGVSATADATALKNCINAHTTLSQYFLATSASGVVTLTAIGPALGVIGNMFKLASSDGTNLAVTAFASGADDSTAQTYSF